MALAGLAVTLFFGVPFCTAAGQITAVNYVPEITPYKMAGRVTSSTVTVKQPTCYFENLSNMPCTPDQCQVWLVAAVGSGTNNFDADKLQSSFNILSASPYPTAFTGNPPKNYFLTEVGVQKAFPCQQPFGILYFRVGDQGNCSTPNCNGILPAGSTVSVKYVLVDPRRNNVSSETPWSKSITLYTLKDPASLDDGIGERSAGMIVITSILSVLLALLLLMLCTGLIYANRGKLCQQYKSTPYPTLGSLRLKKYDTHQLKNPVAYNQQTFQNEVKKYSDPEVPTKYSYSNVSPQSLGSLNAQRYEHNNLKDDGRYANPL
ncbi:uroplakin-3b-like protein 1 [Amia ocellicauda]|uniref:uroplakin-3b-like protein 1 n=1 Tax=Amia ocellicauda TaxID=2972642 RepID=UPI0034641CEC